MCAWSGTRWFFFLSLCVIVNHLGLSKYLRGWGGVGGVEPAKTNKHKLCRCVSAAPVFLFMITLADSSLTLGLFICREVSSKHKGRPIHQSGIETLDNLRCSSKNAAAVQSQCVSGGISEKCWYRKENRIFFFFVLFWFFSLFFLCFGCLICYCTSGQSTTAHVT